MSWRRSKWLWIMVGVATAGRLVWAFATYGHAFDIESMLIVRQALLDDPLRMYSHVTSTVGGGVELLRWPYPPLFVPWILAAGSIDSVSPLPFHGLIQIPSILADAGLTVLIYAFLRWRGAGERLCLLAAALVAFGPSFAVISGYHGQTDAVAILPAVAALCVWELRSRRRALLAGLLIGAGIAIKTVPGLMLLALLPGVRDRREALTLIGAAVAVPAILFLPFLIADPDGVIGVLDYSGAPGLGGLSLLLQPNLAADWLTGHPPHLSDASEALVDLGALPLILALVGAAFVLFRYRPSAIDGALFVWLVVYASASNIFMQYAVWGLPFLLLAGYVRTALAVELWLTVPLIVTYATVWESRSIAAIYSPMMIALWAATVAGVFILGRRIVAGRRLNPVGVQPALVSFEERARPPAPAPTRTAPDTA